MKYTWCQLGMHGEDVIILKFRKLGKPIEKSSIKDILIQRPLIGVDVCKCNKQAKKDAEFRKNPVTKKLEMRWKHLIPGNKPSSWFELTDIFTQLKTMPAFDNLSDLELYLEVNNLWDDARR